MGVKTNFKTGASPVEVLTAFKSQAHRPYTSIYIKSGDGRHSFGQSEFYHMGGLATDIRDAIKIKHYELDEKMFFASLTKKSAIITFKDEDIRQKFMDAMLGRHVEIPSMLVQVSNKSREWHQAAEEHLDHVATQRRKEKLPTRRTSQRTNVAFGDMLMDYGFSDINMMIDFCKKIESGAFDKKAAAMQRTTQMKIEANLYG